MFFSHIIAARVCPPADGILNMAGISQGIGWWQGNSFYYYVNRREKTVFPSSVTKPIFRPLKSVSELAAHEC